MKTELQEIVAKHDAMKKEAFAASEKPGGQIALIRVEVADYYKKLPGLLAEAIAIAEQCASAPQIVLEQKSLQAAVQEALERLVSDGGEPEPRKKQKPKAGYPPPPPGALPINEMIRKQPRGLEDPPRPNYQRVLYAAKKGDIQLYGEPGNYCIVESDYLAWLETNG